MKAREKEVLLAAVIGAATLMTASAPAEVTVGASYAGVREKLGDPAGYLESETRQWLRYERGIIKLENGRVVEVDLLSEEEFAARRKREMEEREQLRREREKRRAARIAEGGRILEKQRRDVSFLMSPAAHQVAFWREFRKDYPEIVVEAEYAAALARYEQERERQARLRAQERRIRNLEEQVKRAEQRQWRQPSFGIERTVYASPIVIREPRRRRSSGMRVRYPGTGIDRREHQFQRWRQQTRTGIRGSVHISF